MSAGARRVLVFGGSGRVGGAVCELLAARGARVAFTYLRNRAAADDLMARISQISGIQADLANPEAVEGAVSRAANSLGGLDAFIHAAAHADAGEAAKLANLDAAAFDRTIAINVRSAFLAARALLAHFAAAQRGEVVFVGSIDSVKPAPSPPHYVASKAALRGLATALAKDLGPRNVRVNVVAPGLLDGGIARMVPDEVRRQYLKYCSLKRLGRFAEVAELCAFLALENTYITGQTIAVDGAL